MIEINKKYVISQKIRDEDKDFKYAGYIGLVTKIEGDKVTLDFGKEEKTVDKKYVKGIRE